MAHWQSKRSSSKSQTMIVAVLAVVAVIAAHAQEPIDRDAVAKIREEGHARSEVGRLFNTLTTAIGPRLTGSPSFRQAAEWARKTFADWGLQNARLEAWEFGRGWTLERFTFEMIEPYYMPLIGYPEAWSPSTPGEMVSVPVFVGGHDAEAVEKLRDGGQLKGAIVLSQPMMTSFIRQDRRQPTEASQPATQPTTSGQQPAASADRTQRINRALREGGAAVVLRTSRGEHGTLFVLGRDAADNTTPRVVVAGEHYNMLARMLQRGMPVKLRVNVQSTFHDTDRNAHNVIAEIPGSDPTLRDEVVMFGAHLDSYHSAPGATDNADGSAIVMEAARILKTIAARPRRTIRVALWGGEEQGLLGSRQYVERYLTGDTHQSTRDRLSVYFNVDPGTGPIYGFYLENQEAVRPIFDAWLEPFRDLGARHNVMQGIGNTDHLSFRRAGIPAFNPIQDYTSYDVRTHHTNMDTVERVNEADLRQAAIVLASFVYHAAVRTERIPRAGS